MRRYVLQVMLLSFGVNYLLLLSAAQISRGRASGLRMIFASLLNAAHSAACFLPRLHWLGLLPFRAAVIAAAGFTAFLGEPKTGKKMAVYALLEMSLTGSATLIGQSRISAWVLSAMLICLLALAGFENKSGAGVYLPLRISNGSSTVDLLALRDTGNTLRDPVSGEPVLIIGAKAASELTGLSKAQLSKPLETMTAGILPGLRLIPYRTVGQSGGMLLAMRFPDVMLGNRKCPRIVAFSPGGLGEGDKYQALSGGMV